MGQQHVQDVERRPALGRDRMEQVAEPACTQLAARFGLSWRRVLPVSQALEVPPGIAERSHSRGQLVGQEEVQVDDRRVRDQRAGAAGNRPGRRIFVFRLGRSLCFGAQEARTEARERLEHVQPVVASEEGEDVLRMVGVGRQ